MFIYWHQFVTIDNVFLLFNVLLKEYVDTYLISILESFDKLLSIIYAYQPLIVKLKQYLQEDTSYFKKLSESSIYKVLKYL